MTSEARKHPVTKIDEGWRDQRPVEPRQRPHFVTVGMGAVLGVVLIGLVAVAGAFMVRTVSAGLSGGHQGQIQTGSIAGNQQSLVVQRRLVDGKRDAVATYATKLAEFKAVTARPPGAPGINLDASEARRRDDVLTGLVLDCIDAVDHYNLAAQARSLTQLRSAGLPEHFVWAVDCAAGQ